MTEPEVPPTGESKSDLTVGGSATKRQVAFCTWCKASWPVKSALEADRWLRTHPCPANPREGTKMTGHSCPSCGQPRALAGRCGVCILVDAITEPSGLSVPLDVREARALAILDRLSSAGGGAPGAQRRTEGE